jgi:hypothetical protein
MQDHYNFEFWIGQITDCPFLHSFNKCKKKPNSVVAQQLIAEAMEEQWGMKGINGKRFRMKWAKAALD